MKMLSDKNLAVKEYDKINKYKDLEIEHEKQGHLKTSDIPIYNCRTGYNQERKRNILTRFLVALIYKR